MATVQENMDAVQEEKKEAPVQGLDESEPAPEPEIILISPDGAKFTISKKIACKYSNLINEALEKDLNATQIPLTEVKTGKTLANVLKLFGLSEKYEKESGKELTVPEKPLKSNNLVDCGVPTHIADFLEELSKQDLQDLYDLILAFNYLDSQVLLQIACAKVATIIKGQPLDKIKEILSTEPGKEVEEEKKE